VVVVWYVLLPVLVLSECCGYLFVMYYIFLIAGVCWMRLFLCVCVVIDFICSLLRWWVCCCLG